MSQSAVVVNLAQFRASRVGNAKDVVSQVPDIIRKRYDFEISFPKEDDPERRPQISYGPGAQALFSEPALATAEPARVVRDLFEVAAWTAQNCFEAGDAIVARAPVLLMMFDTDGNVSLRWPDKALTTKDQHIYIAEQFAKAFEMLTEGFGGNGDGLSITDVLSAK